jgi:hypothetical protein
MKLIGRGETKPTSGPQVNYIPSFQKLSATRHVDSSANLYVPRGKQHTGCQKCRAMNWSTKLKKLYFVCEKIKLDNVRNGTPV